MNICPCCKYGELRKVIVKSTKEEIIICEECEVMWLRNEVVSENTGIAFYLYAKSIDIENNWSELIIQG